MINRENNLSQIFSGKQILITREKKLANNTFNKIIELGGYPISFPTIRIQHPSDYIHVDKKLKSINDYDWILFTSSNGVKYFLNRADKRGISPKSIKCNIGAVGEQTAKSVEKFGINVCFIPKTFLTKNLALELPNIKGKKIILVRSEGVNKNMSQILLQRGALVDEVYVYKIVPKKQRRKIDGVDVIMFTSSSNVVNFKKLEKKIKKDVIISCIGPETAYKAKTLGYKIDIIASIYTIDGLLNTIIQYFYTDRNE